MSHFDEYLDHFPERLWGKFGKLGVSSFTTLVRQKASAFRIEGFNDEHLRDLISQGLQDDLKLVKKKIYLKRVRELLDELAEINRLDLHDVEVYEGGPYDYRNKIDIPPEVIEDFKFVGLSNINFFELEYWKGKNEKEAN